MKKRTKEQVEAVILLAAMIVLTFMGPKSRTLLACFAIVSLAARIAEGRKAAQELGISTWAYFKKMEDHGREKNP
jgi:hypothetical protein